MTDVLLSPTLGAAVVTPVDRDTVRVEVEAKHPTAKRFAYRYLIWGEVRRGRVPPAGHDWYGLPKEGKASEARRGTGPPRRISIGRGALQWGPVLAALESEIVPLVQDWMRLHDEDMRRAEVRRLDQRAEVLSREIADLENTLDSLQRQRGEVRAAIDAIQRPAPVSSDQVGPTPLPFPLKGRA
jgi:hypothetical protein